LEAPTQPSHRRWWNRIALLFLAALACRLAFVAFEPATRPLGDERTWLALALEQVAAPPASFNPLRSPLLFYPPLHPWLIGAAHTLGGGLLAVRVVQALLGAFLVPVVGLVGRRAVGPRAGLVAAALTAFFPTLVWYSGHLWSEPLFLVLLWWSLERALAANEGRSGAAVASGVLLGLAALTRELPLYFVPVLAAWMLSRRERGSLVRAALLVLTTAVVVAPWTLRNQLLFDAFVPVSTMGGRALWEGNTSEDRSAVYAEHDRLVREEGPVAAYREAVRQGRRSILQRQPLWLLDKAIHEVPDLFTPVNMVLVHIEKRGYGTPRPVLVWAVAAITLVPYLAVMTLFIAGLARIVWSRPLVLLLLFFLFYVLLHVVVHGHHRFRLPLLPVIFTVGASVLPGVEAVAASWSPKRRLVAAGLGLALVASVLQAFSGFLREPAFVGHGASATADCGLGGDTPFSRQGASARLALAVDSPSTRESRMERPLGRGPS
jgi:4-amino-4-deoxy-L-arabinose transferase-like glycosyltransferase